MTTLAQVRDRLLAGGPFRRDDGARALLAVRGRDAADFLQRLCSQDVAALGPGGLRPAAFLDPKGRLQHTCLLGRGQDGFWLETHPDQREGLLALLDRYHFTEKVQFEAGPAGCAEWIGGDLPAAVAAGVEDGGDGVRIAFARRGVAFVRGYGAVADGVPAGAAPLAAERAELLGMLAGLVRVGVDSEPATLALEADLDDHLSRSKGCYTGQEIVARIDTYGHVNRRLVLLWLPGEGAIPAPVPLCEPEDGVPVGRVMRALPLPGGVDGRGGRLGLGYLPKDYWAVGTALRLGDEHGPMVMVLGF